MTFAYSIGQSQGHVNCDCEYLVNVDKIGQPLLLSIHNMSPIGLSNSKLTFVLVQLYMLGSRSCIFRFKITRKRQQILSTLLMSSNRKYNVGFQLAYLHLILTNFNSQRHFLGGHLLISIYLTKKRRPFTHCLRAAALQRLPAYPFAALHGVIENPTCLSLS